MRDCTVMQKYGWRAAWKDPTDWVMSSCPWKDNSDCSSLLRITTEDLDATALQIPCQLWTDPKVHSHLKQQIVIGWYSVDSTGSIVNFIVTGLPACTLVSTLLMFAQLVTRDFREVTEVNKNDKF